MMKVISFVLLDEYCYQIFDCMLFSSGVSSIFICEGIRAASIIMWSNRVKFRDICGIWSVRLFLVCRLRLFCSAAPVFLQR